MKAVKVIIRECEPDSVDVAGKRRLHESNDLDLKEKKEQIDNWENEMKPTWEFLQAGVVGHDRHVNDKTILRYKAMQETEKGLTKQQEQNWIKKNQAFDSSFANYGPNSMHRQEAQRAKKAYDDEMAILQQALKALEVAWNASNKALEDAMSNQLHRPIEKAMEKILAEFRIYFQQHYTMTLTGKPIQRFLENADEILSRILMLLPEDVQERKREIFNLLKDACHALHYCVSVMNRMDEMSDEEVDEFGEIAKIFGMKYRQALNKGTALRNSAYSLVYHIHSQLNTIIQGQHRRCMYSKYMLCNGSDASSV